MDTSEAYIKMVDHPLIQGQWKPAEGDFYFFHGSKTFSIYSGMCMDFINIDDIWVPRQDQVVKMLQPSYDHPSTIATYFGLFCDNKEMYTGIYAKKGRGFINKFNSMEQLWLAFYMYEKHKLVWKGDKWREDESR